MQTRPPDTAREREFEWSRGRSRAFAIATMFWGIAGFLVGVVIAAAAGLAAAELRHRMDLTFGRLRPLHTSAVIFAFGGNALIGTAFHVVQRTCRARLFGGAPLGWFVLLGLPVLHRRSRRTGYLLGITQSKEYAEPEWYVDLWLTIVWVAYLIAYLGTMMKREEPHIYVANWFYLAFIITIAMLHVVNNLSMPVSFVGTKSYGAWSGVQDAHDPVVVRPQRGRLLPDRRLPRHDVLLHPEAGEPADLFATGCRSCTSGR